MTPYRFRAVVAVAVFVLLVFAVMAFGAVDTWALMIFEVGIFGLTAFWVVRMAFASLRPVWNPIYLPLGVAAAWTGAQSLLGLSVDRYRTGAEALKWLAMCLLFVLAGQVFPDESIRNKFSKSLVWFGFALSAFGLVQYFASRDVIYWVVPVPAGKVFGPFVNGNHFTALLELIVPAALLLALRRSEKRLIYVVVCGMILGAVVVCASRAGTALVAIEVIVVLGVKAWARGRAGVLRKRALWPVAGLAAAAILSFALAGTQQFLEGYQEEQPYRIRWSVVQATWRLFLSRPWTGYGAGTFEQVYPSAAPFDLRLLWPHAHNDPVQFAMEWGAVGIGVLGGILGLLLRRRWPQDVWLAVVLPVIAVLAHSWVDFPLQIPAVAAAWLVTLAQALPAGAGAAARHRGRVGQRAPALADVPAEIGRIG